MDWYNKACFYHIYPLGYCGQLQPNDYVSEPTGKIKDVIKQIPQIKAMGLNAVYFGPVFESVRHGYDTVDYRVIDRRLGTNADFKEVCDALGIDMSLLAKVYESCEVTGKVTASAAELTGLAEGTIVVGGAGDNAAAAVGTGVVVEGKAFTTIGTSGVVFAHSDKVQIDPQGRVHTFCAAVPGAYTVMSCTLAAGLSLKWYRDTFCQAEIDAAKEMDTDPYILMNQQAEKSPIGANRLIFLPYLMGERSPINDTNARGTFIGMTMDTTRADLVQAVLEGVAYAIRDSVEVARSLGITINSSKICGGGAKSPLWKKMIANILNAELECLESEQGPGMGGAMLAMVACGEYASVQEVCNKFVKVASVVKPEPELVDKYEARYQQFKKIYPAVKALFPEIQ